MALSRSNNIIAFAKRHQVIIASVFLLLLSLHLTLGSKDRARTYILSEALSTVAAPMQRAMLSAWGGITGVWDGYVALIGVKKENDTLKTTIGELLAENNRLKEELNLAARLKTVLAFKEQAPYSTIAASVVGFNVDSWSRSVIIDKGEKEGIQKDLAVVSAEGVMGRVIEVNSGTSRVLLSIDPRSDIDVVIQRNRVRAVAEGNGGAIILKYVRQLDDVEVGDKVLTSGITGIFPKGMAVGVVTRVDKGKDSFFKTVEVAPAVDFQKVEEAVVVTQTGFKPE